MGVSGEPPATYERYNNVYLFKEEYAELQTEYPDRLERLIEEMSHYLAATGKTYQNYAAALRRWADKDRKGAASGAGGLYRRGRAFILRQVQKAKEAYFTPDKAVIFGRARHPAECDCQRKIREEREAARNAAATLTRWRT